MDNKRVAEKIAEALFRLVEREKRLNKGEFIETIERELAVCLVDLQAYPMCVVGPGDVTKVDRHPHSVALYPPQAELPFGGRDFNAEASRGI